MKVYTTDKIRNVAVLGHGGAGKTTLVEAMCYLSKLTTRLGRVEDGNTVSDFTKEEQKRGISIRTSLVPVEWNDYKFNILDTPGYFDFSGEVDEAMSVADGAIIVVSGKSGIEAGTEKAWELCEKYHLPRMFFVTDMDIDDVSYRKAIEDLTAVYGKKIAPFNMPIRDDGKFTGYVNVIQQKAFRYKAIGVVEPTDIPDYSKEHLAAYHTILMEAVAETSEEFGDNAESLLMAAGLNEIQTLGFAMGATHAETFTSIAGVGDLEVTCKSKYGRNRRFGQDLIKKDIMSQFSNLDDLIENMTKLGYLSEGAIACKYVHEIAQRKNLKLTICDGLYRILNKEISPRDFIAQLLTQEK